MSRPFAIPFTQYVMPHGRKRSISIEMPKDVAEKAFHFIEQGGWYEAEVLQTGMVSLTACMVVEDEPQDIAIKLHKNGPGMGDAVKKLIESSIEYIENAT